MALLDLVRDVCDEIGLPRPSAVGTSTDQLARQMFALANAELRNLSKRFDWPVLVREHTFETVPGQAVYLLPDGFSKMVGDSAYNADQYYNIKGSLSPQEWQWRKSQNLASLDRSKLRIYGSPAKINILPTPIAAETVVFEYITSNFAVSSGGVAIPKYAADSDTAYVDEHLVGLGLKWRTKHAKGLEFSADLVEYESSIKSGFAREIAAPSITIGGKTYHDDAEITGGYVRDSGYGA